MLDSLLSHKYATDWMIIFFFLFSQYVCVEKEREVTGKPRGGGKAKGDESMFGVREGDESTRSLRER